MLGNRVTATFEVSWNLDAVSGWNAHPSDMVDRIERVIVDGVEHYKPEVKLVSVPQLVLENLDD